MRKIIISILLIIIVINVASCGLTPIIDDYKNYECYDYHIKSSNAGKVFGRYINEIDNKDFLYCYSKIANIDDSQFISAQIKWNVYLTQLETFILQNPENYIDIKSEWTIKEVQFFVVNNVVNDKTFTYRSNDTMYSTSENIYINEIISMWNVMDSSSTSSAISGDYGQISYNYNNGNEFTFHIRITFNESESLVWESYIFHSENSYSIDIGTVSKYYDKLGNNYHIEPESELFDLIKDLTKTIKEAQN